MDVKQCAFSDEGLNVIEETAEKRRNLSLLFLIRILREIQEIKALLNKKQYTCDCSNHRTDSANPKNHCLAWYCTSHWLSSLYDDFLHERTAGEVMPCVTCERKNECQTSPPVNFVPIMEKTGVKINTTFNSEKRCQS